MVPSLVPHDTFLTSTRLIAVQGKVHVARALHCVGLFGGTNAYYTGGLSLHAAMPQACLVACQLQPLDPQAATVKSGMSESIPLLSAAMLLC